MNTTMELCALWFVRRDLKFEQAQRKLVQKKGFYVCMCVNSYLFKL